MYINTKFDLQDAEHKTPLHVAIKNQHAGIITLLLCHPSIDLTKRDRTGLTPFAAALTCRNDKAARSILDKLPAAAEQVIFLKTKIYNKCSNDIFISSLIIKDATFCTWLSKRVTLKASCSYCRSM